MPALRGWALVLRWCAPLARRGWSREKRGWRVCNFGWSGWVGRDLLGATTSVDEERPPCRDVFRVGLCVLKLLFLVASSIGCWAAPCKNTTRPRGGSLPPPTASTDSLHPYPRTRRRSKLRKKGNRTASDAARCGRCSARLQSMGSRITAIARRCGGGVGPPPPPSAADPPATPPAPSRGRARHRNRAASGAPPRPPR